VRVCVCVCVWLCMKEGERKRGDGKRDAESIDVCLHHVADGGGGDRRSIYPSVCLYVCFDRLSYLRSKLRNGAGDGADAVARMCV